MSRFLFSLLAAAAATLAALPDPVSPDPDSPRPIEAVDSVFIEDLTWMEVRDRMQAPSTMRSTLELLVRASMTDALDPDVLRARDKLAQLLAAKPSTTEAGRDLGMKISEAVRKRARKESH